MCRVAISALEEVGTDHVSDHAQNLVVTRQWNECIGFRFAETTRFCTCKLAHVERIDKNKLIRDPYPNRTPFRKEERRSEKGGVAQRPFTERTSRLWPTVA